MRAESAGHGSLRIAGATVRALGLMLVGSLWFGSSTARAQCVPTWLPGEGIPGVSGTIHALVKFDDGGGERLYAAGEFTTAGTSSAARIAVWDGAEWQPLGSGLQNTCFTLAVFNGKLYAGGDFSTAGGVSVQRVAAWDGTAWAALPGATFTGTTRRPQAMVVFNNELIVAGTFDNAGESVANSIAAFDGTSWRSLGTGVMEDGARGTVRALAVFNGELYATGEFDTAGGVAASHIAKWNGVQWSPLSSGLDSATGGYALQVFGSELFVGGAFSNAGGVPSPRGARWNGSQWSAAPVGTSSVVLSFGVHAGQLYAGGTFQNGGGTTSNRGFVRWNGTAFVADGTNVPNGGINAMASFGTDLIAAGSFTAVNGLDVNRISRYEGAQTWRTFGSGFNLPVRAILSKPGELIIGGNFTTIDAKPIRHVVRWDGASWSEVGAGGIQSNNTSGVRTLIEYQGSLYAGGAFQNNADNTIPSMFARFDGTNWVKVGGTAFGAGSGKSVNATTLYNGQLVLAGSFANLAANADIDGIATWNGTAYGPVGTGLGGEVYALAVHNGELYAGGAITSAGGNTAIDNIAKWNGTNWVAVGEGLNNYVFALYSWNGSLYAGGQFSASGGTSFVGIARWDGATWSAVGGSMNAGSVYALSEFNGSLVAMGSMRKIVDLVTFDRIALWSGSAWSGFGTGLSTVGSGVAPFAGAIGVLNGELYVGSDALSAGGKISAYLAHWGSLEPCIQSSPIPGSICRGGQFTFNVAATGKPALRYQWRLDTMDIENANGPSYTVTDASEADEGLYDCVIENDFGIATSAAALLQLCDSDLDCSGTVDDADFSVFAVAYDVLDCAEPSMPPECPADLNRDGVVDDLDFSIFVVAYDVLLCP